MKKKRIIFGLNDFLVGGMQRQFVEQLPFFDRQRFEIILVTLFTLPDKSTLYEELPDDLEVHHCNFKGFWDVRSWYKLCVLLKRLRPDIVVSSLFLSNAIFRLLKPFFGYVSIAREHNTHFHRKFDERLLNRLLAPLSHKIVGVSATVADFTAAHEGIPRNRFIVIRNGVNNEKMRAALEKLPSKEIVREELGFEKDELVLLNVARLTPQKNHQLLIEGFALFLRDHPRSRLAIVGGGSLLPQLQSYAAEKGIGERITFFGYRRDMTKFYKAADALVSTSKMEGLSNAYLEALAAGLPLVATKTAGTDELLQDGYNGFTIPHPSSEEVVGALKRLVSVGPETLKSNAEETAKRCSIDKTVAEYEKLFETI